MFSCEYCENFTNTYFEKHLRTFYYNYERLLLNVSNV